MTKETWTAKHDEAVLLVAEDKLTDVQIAEKVGISKRTLEDWKKDDLFLERLDAAITEIRKVLMRHGIARLDRRLGRLDKTWNDLQHVIEERKRLADGGGAGDETGLIIGKEKMIGKGFDAEQITEYELDTSILAELRALEMQAAKECGQWVDKRQTDLTSGGKPLEPGPDLRQVATDDLKLIKTILEGTKKETDGDAAEPA